MEEKRNVLKGAPGLAVLAKYLAVFRELTARKGCGIMEKKKWEGIGMAFSPREKEARKRYKELLTEEGVSKASNYLGRVQTVLSDLARESGVLEAESLFAVESQEERERIRDWWAETGKSSIHDTATKTYMEKFITVFWRLPLEQTRNRVTAQRLREPSHGLRLQTLFSAMAEHRGSETKTTVYENLISTLRRKPNCYVDSSSFKESESEFRAIRRDILAGLQKSDEVGSELKEIFSESARRAGMYKGAVYQCVMEHGHQILWDLSRRRLSFEDSILSPMAAICAHPTGDDTASMLELIRLVLEDSNAQGGRENPAVAPGEALQDPRLWESGLLEPWLKEKGGTADCFAALVLYARAMSRKKETLLRAEELFSQAIDTVEWNWENIKKALPEEGWWPGVPAEQVEQAFDRAVYPAQLRISRAEVLTAMAGTLTDVEKETRGYWLMRAREDLRRARVALEERKSQRHIIKEMESGQPAIYALFVRKNLCEAETHRLLAREETVENCLADAVHNYFAPARTDLLQAWQYLKQEKDVREDFPARAAAEMDEEIAHLEHRWEVLADECTQDFFNENSPVLRRMALRAPEDMAAYRAEHGEWKEWLGLDLPPVPVISRPLDPESLLGAEEFEPVYSGAADSVSGKNVEQNKEPLELMTFQVLGSSKTMLLQFNQIVDNRSMLMMLPVPGYRQACREGIVALSCYGDVNSPRDYLVQALKKPKFAFSSTALYDLPEGAETIEGSGREMMLNWLNGVGGVTLHSFPEELREEAELLMECYRMLDECFQPADLLRYHQNNLQNQPHRELVNVPLDQVIRERTEAMERCGKNPQLMQTMRALVQKSEGVTDRSVYDQMIDGMLRQEAYPREHLEKFRRLVHQCYFFSNGRRSCKTILSTETDPDLILPGDVLRVGDYQLDDLYHQRRLPGKNSKIDWADISRVAMIVRSIDRRDKHLSVEKRVQIKERETGCGFTATGNDAFLTAMTARTANGHVTRIEPDSSKAGEAFGIHRQKN